MDILQEIQEEHRKEKLYNFLQKYGKIIIIIILISIVCASIYFSLYLNKKKIALEYHSKYTAAMNSSQNDKIANLEMLKYADNVYGTLSSIELGSFYADIDPIKSIRNYEIVLKSKHSNKIYKDFCQLMIIGVSVNSGRVDLNQGMELYKGYLERAKFFKSLATLAQASLLVKQGKMGKNAILNNILTSSEKYTSNLLFYIAQIIKKRLL